MPFGTSEFARFLHTMVDPRVGRALNHIRSFCTLAGLDMDPSDRWNDIAKLFNDKPFKPQPLPANTNGVIPHHINYFDPNLLISERTPDVLKAKWGKLNSDYGTAVERFKQSGQHDPESFPSFLQDGATYVMYCHCFFERYPHVRHDRTHALHYDAQREEVIYDVGTPIPISRKRRLSNLFCKEVPIVGYEEFTNALQGWRGRWFGATKGRIIERTCRARSGINVQRNGGHEVYRQR